jgi:hypothetical protein
VAPPDQPDPDHRPHRLTPTSAKPERRVRPDGSRAHFLAASAAGNTKYRPRPAPRPALAAAAALKIDLTANGCSVVPQPREREITDALVELLISTVHRVGARADKRVVQELVNAFKRVTGKENILFAIAEACVGAPDEPVRAVVFPAVTGGEQTLRELVHEYKTQGPVYRRTVQTTLKASYSNHYRRGLIDLLEVLEFRSNNATHRPVLDALALIKRHADARLTYYRRRCRRTRRCWVTGRPWCSRTPAGAAAGSSARSTRSAPSRRCGNGCGARQIDPRFTAQAGGTSVPTPTQD